MAGMYRSSGREWTKPNGLSVVVDGTGVGLEVDVGTGLAVGADVSAGLAIRADVGAGLAAGVDVGADLAVGTGITVAGATTFFIKTTGEDSISVSPPQARRNIAAKTVTKRNIFLICILLIEKILPNIIHNPDMTNDDDRR